MNITIFGATGRVGNNILRSALEDGHLVTALVRTPSKLTPHENLTIIEGDIREQQSVNVAIQGADAVVSAIGTDKTTTLTDAIPLIIEAMQKVEIKRIITIGTAGILQSRTNPELYRFQSTESKRRLTFAAEQHAKVFEKLAATNLDWTVVCPTYLPDGVSTGQWRTEMNFLPENGVEISVGDTAEFAYKELLDPQFTKVRVGLAY
ncbi:SDR family oxidoreductase [Paenisporosarcina quisquiliarum]|uniref:SDR family oxidoreductase n=1 Tax=Paenisporosarcina quisquiliarum TaxID=365346 RepID=A0A9X3LIC7_9BACL|nr:SDR family oxidoreductase [Paenisporosarcina quisquiliarum]MCZ8537561.1 SDR family oxidoreductase [Paenisporosarcina quisquiliarum]